MKCLLIILILGLLLLPSCIHNDGEISQYALYSGNETPPEISDVFTVVITNNAMSIDKSANISMMSPGRTAIVTYRVFNNSDCIIKPKIFTELWRDPKAYKPEYSGPPSGIKEWLTIPETVNLKPNEVIDINVLLSIPNDAVIENKRWKFAVAVAPGTDEFIQSGIAAWWFINMR